MLMERDLDFQTKISIPKQSEVRNNLGDELSKIVFDFSHNEINKYLGLSPPLAGPGSKLWIPPSEKSIERSSLQPVIYSNCVKACTHGGILEIGEQALNKYRQDTEEKIRAKLNEVHIEEKNLSKAGKRRAVELALQKTRERYRNCILKLKCRFKNKLETKLEKAMVECKLKMQEAILQERADITRQMLKKMRDEIGFVVISLYLDFQLKLNAEKQNMIAEFNIIMRCDRLKTDAAVRETIRQKEEEFRIKLHELELQKIVDLTYVLCSERMRCSSEKYEMHQSFEGQIDALHKMLLKANRVIKLIKTVPRGCENNKTYETKVMEIVKQFQKFINYAFGAVPGQAEFFLSLESLLTFELGKKNPEYKDKEKIKVEGGGVCQVVEIVDKCGRKWKPLQLIPDILQLTAIEDQIKVDKNYMKCQNSANGLFRSDHSLNLISFCHFQDMFFERADFQTGDIENEIKTMTELAEDARFVMDLKSVEISDSVLKGSLLNNIMAHNQIFKSVTEKNEDGKKMFKIIGDNGVEHLQTPEQFKISRMQSLIKIFNVHPSLQNILLPHMGKAVY